MLGSRYPSRQLDARRFHDVSPYDGTRQKAGRTVLTTRPIHLHPSQVEGGQTNGGFSMYYTVPRWKKYTAYWKKLNFFGYGEYVTMCVRNEERLKLVYRMLTPFLPLQRTTL
jgi:hypothetical protein